MAANNPIIKQGDGWFMPKSPESQEPEPELRHRLCQLRQAANLDLKELATLADVAPGDIRCIEQGEYAPPVSVLEQLAEALKVPAEELLKCRRPGFQPERVANV